MPELPEVEHVKRGIAPGVEGTTIQEVQFSEQVKLGKIIKEKRLLKDWNWIPLKRLQKVIPLIILNVVVSIFTFIYNGVTRHVSW